MNDHFPHTETITNSTKRDLLGELAKEVGMARRQELFKAMWRLDRQKAQSVSSQSLRPPVTATVKPESKSDQHNPRSVQELGLHPHGRTVSPIATAMHQNADGRSRETMNDRQTLATLNELHAIENFSLANYLRYAKPWVAAADQRLDEAIRHIADEQMESSDRVGSLIIERRGHVEGGSFPMRFTAFNDLSVAYLAPRVMADQERIVREVGAVARQLCSDPAAYDLSNEILSAEHAHLDSLRDVIDGRKSGTCHNHEVARPSEPCCEKPNTAVATAA